MTTEQLLMKRFKVIADYPGSIFPVGHVIETRENQKQLQKGFENYPHLFKELQWWEDRKPEDMPEYVRWHDGQVFKVSKWDKNSIGYPICDVGIAYLFIRELQPAYEQEYQSFKNSTP